LNKIVKKFYMNKAFTLIELLVVVAIIGILAAVGVTTFNGFQEKAKNAVIKSNHQKVLETIKADIARCYLLGGSNAVIERYERTGGKTFPKRKQRCGGSAFDQGVLQIDFLVLGLRDPIILDYIPDWTNNGRTLPNDHGAVYAGVPFKTKWYPAYWVGKTYILNTRAPENEYQKRLKIQTYLMDEKTLLLDYIEIPFR